MYEVHVDFDTFWHSAVALTQGGDIYTTPAKLTNLNPPLLTVLLTPFAALDAFTAYRVWVVLTLLMVVGSMLAVARELRLRPLYTAGAVLAVLASSPLHGTLVLGQIYPLLLVGLVAGWIAERRGRPVLAAVLFGITVALKPSLAPVLLLSRRSAGGRRCGRVGVGGGRVAGRGSPWRPVERAGVAAYRVQFAGARHRRQRLTAGSRRAVRPAAVARAGLGLVVLGGTLVVLARHRDRIDPAGTAVWAVLAAGLLLSPIAWHNYLMLLWPGVLVLITLGRGHRHRDARGGGDPGVVERGRRARGRHGALALLRDPSRLLGRVVRRAVPVGPSSVSSGEPSSVSVASPTG